MKDVMKQIQRAYPALNVQDILDQLETTVFLYVTDDGDDVSCLEKATTFQYISKTDKVISLSTLRRIKAQLVKSNVAGYWLWRSLDKKSINIIEVKPNCRKTFIDVMANNYTLQFKDCGKGVNAPTVVEESVSQIDSSKWYTIGFVGKKKPQHTTFLLARAGLSTDTYYIGESSEFYARVNDAAILKSAINEGCTVGVSSLKATTMGDLIALETKNASEAKIQAFHLNKYIRQEHICVTAVDIIDDKIRLSTSERLLGVATAQLRGHCRFIRKLPYLSSFKIAPTGNSDAYGTYGFKPKLGQCTVDNIVDSLLLEKVPMNTPWEEDSFYITIRVFIDRVPKSSTYRTKSIITAIQAAVECSNNNIVAEIGYTGQTGTVTEIFDNNLDKSIHRLVVSPAIPATMKFSPFDEVMS